MLNYNHHYTFTFENQKALDKFRLQALHWCENFEYIANFDSNYTTQYKDSTYHWLLGIGAKSKAYLEDLNTLEAYLQAKEARETWHFLALSYELKNTILPSKIYSKNPDKHQLPNITIFQPQYLILSYKEHPLILHIFSFEKGSSALDIFNIIQGSTQLNTNLFQPQANVVVQAACEKATYLQDIKAIQNHIIDGDVYEVNYCQEFSIQDYTIAHPIALYEQLNAIAQTPFAVYFRAQDWHLCCASPERYISYKEHTLRSQPIKGTAPRHANTQEDLALAQSLQNSIKDRAENLMIVDLVRNDLARICEVGSVEVEELCALYDFPSVWQLVSSVIGKYPQQNNPNQTIIEVLKASFPMGSMTGAPKIAALEIIDNFEKNCRGWYSGSIGYIDNKGNFDLNVVIRSIFYNAQRKYISWQVGGAIVFDSVAEAEYEECETKMRLIKRVLSI